MKQYLLFFIFTIVSTFTFAQETKLHNRIGMRDSRYLQYEYTIGRHVPLMLEHSIYSDKLKLQHFRVAAGYTNDFLRSHLHTDFRAYAGGIWRGNYHDFGAFLTLGYRFDTRQRYQLSATLNPHYDTGLDYKTCVSALALVGMNDVFSIVAEFTNIPEFRQSDDRIRFGVDIHFASTRYGWLSVRPLLSVPLGQRYEKVRVHVNFDYAF